MSGDAASEGDFSFLTTSGLMALGALPGFLPSAWGKQCGQPKGFTKVKEDSLKKRMLLGIVGCIATVVLEEIAGTLWSEQFNVCALRALCIFFGCTADTKIMGKLTTVAYLVAGRFPIPSWDQFNMHMVRLSDAGAAAPVTLNLSAVHAAFQADAKCVRPARYTGLGPSGTDRPSRTRVTTLRAR